MSKPLSHLTILDLTRLLPGGYCTLLLADLGADVIKVEEPGKGDYIRWMPPMAGGVSAGHLALNRGKRSITLNLKSPEGVEVLKRLVRDADVVIESFRPGVMTRLGVGYEQLAEHNARLIYCAITGYGQDGPYRDRAGHDINYLGFAGVLDIIGERGGPPVDPGVQIGDIGGGGLMAAVGILAALSEREHTGRGRFVDISMTDGAFSWLCFHGATYAMSGEIPKRGEMRLSGEYACYRVYRCADDRYVTVGALEPQFWAALCDAIGAPELIERQFVEPPEQDEVVSRVAEILAGKTRDEWVDALSDLEACFGPVKDVAEAFADPHLVARGMVTTVPTPSGRLPAIGNPVRLVGAEATELGGAPGFGEHTDAVLGTAGYGSEAISALREGGAV